MESFLVNIEKGLGSDIILWFQSWRTDAISALFQPFNLAGEETFFLVLLTIIYWTINKKTGRRLTIIFLFSAWLNAFCKEWWKRPRPFQVSEKVKSAYLVSGYGLPSGHTQSATTIASVLMTETRKRWAIILLILYMFLMGISRMVHGVHFPQDVLIGWILGILVVVVLLKLETKFGRFLADITLNQVIVITLLTAAILLGLTFWTVPNANGIESMITPTAVLIGVIPGVFIESKRVRFSIQGSLKQKCLRYLVGIITALLIKEGLKPVLGIINDHSLFMEAFVRFTRYFALGLWISAGAPWLFIKSGLALSEDNQVD
ncbi:phosphatase PAP2 family protein [bacterium]|nr:phosphatase PAP2 family protein [bacterium]